MTAAPTRPASDVDPPDVDPPAVGSLEVGRQDAHEVDANKVDAQPVVAGDGMLHPVALGACAVLGLNDQLWKSHYGNAVTGKISDFAGMVLFPLLLVAVCEILVGFVKPFWHAPRRVLLSCIAATGLCFSAINFLPFAGRIYQQVWGFLLATLTFSGFRPVSHTVDPSDLVALPLLALAWRVGSSRIHRIEGDPAFRRVVRAPQGLDTD